MNLKLKHLKRIIISIIIIIFVIQLSKIDNSDTKFTLEKIQMGFKGEIINMYDNGKSYVINIKKDNGEILEILNITEYLHDNLRLHDKVYKPFDSPFIFFTKNNKRICSCFAIIFKKDRNNKIWQKKWRYKWFECNFNETKWKNGTLGEISNSKPKTSYQ